MTSNVTMSVLGSIFCSMEFKKYKLFSNIDSLSCLEKFVIECLLVC